jgi:hypothetical protein
MSDVLDRMIISDLVAISAGGIVTAISVAGRRSVSGAASADR